LASRGGAAATAGVIDYKALSVIDNGLVHYYHDSYYIKTSDVYVEIGGRRFKQSSIPVAGKSDASFINA